MYLSVFEQFSYLILAHDLGKLSIIDKVTIHQQQQESMSYIEYKVHQAKLQLSDYLIDQ